MHEDTKKVILDVVRLSEVLTEKIYEAYQAQPVPSLYQFQKIGQASEALKARTECLANLIDMGVLEE